MARGYADTRIADAAEHVPGTSPALVIYYFKTRDQLLTEALRYSEDAWYAAYGDAAAQASVTTAVGRLTELIAMTCFSCPPDPRSARNGCSGSTCGRGRRAIRASRRYGVGPDERWREEISTTVLSGQEERRIQRRY